MGHNVTPRVVDLTKASPDEPSPAADGPAPAAAPAASRHRGRGRGRRRRRDQPKRKAPWWEIPALVALAILIAILVKSFVVQPFYIPSGSMQQTLHINDRILVNKVIYDWRDPEPGDIVVFDAPPGWDDEPVNSPPGNPILRAIRGFGQLIGFAPPDGEVLVKRVIATGGQTVRGFANGTVQVKDKPDGSWRTLHEPYTYDQDPAGGNQNFGPVLVPSGRLWVMGDHRTDSADSRLHCGPGGSQGEQTHCDPTASTVPVDNVIGKAFVIAWPPSRWTTLGTPATFDSSAAPLLTPSALPIEAIVPLLFLRRAVRRRERRR